MLDPLLERLSLVHPYAKQEVFVVSADLAGPRCGDQAIALELSVYASTLSFDRIMNGPIDAFARELGLTTCQVGFRTHSESSWLTGPIRGALLTSVPLLLLLAWSRWSGRRDLALVDWQPAIGIGRALRLGLLTGVALYALANLLAWLGALLGADAYATGDHLIDLARSDVWLSFVPAVLLMPLLEEYLFRALLLERSRRVIGDWAALLYSASVFAVVHRPTSILIGLGLLLVGVGLGWLWLRTRSLPACVTAHAIFNILASLALFSTAN